MTGNKAIGNSPAAGKDDTFTSPTSPVAPSSPPAPAAAASPKAASPGAAPSAPATEPAATEPSSGLLSAQHWAHAADLPVDEGDTGEDGDSALGDDQASSTASITSSILKYRTINGRTYHSESGNSQHWTPNDDVHLESMDINHHLLLLSLKEKLFLAPLDKDIERVVDIGTGTGIWAIDFGDEFPSAEVIGTDISPIQPSWVPPNVKFEIEDCTQPWTLPSDHFDYVHMRQLFGSIDNWDALFAEAYRACKPGGWIESYEASPRMESDHVPETENLAIHEWGKFFIEGGKKLDRTFSIIDDNLQVKGIEKAGFTKINTWDFKAPIGSWPKDARLREIGRYAQAALEQDYEGYVLAMASLQGWTKEEVYVYCAHLRREIRSGKYCPFYRQRVVWAQKPE